MLLFLLWVGLCWLLVLLLLLSVFIVVGRLAVVCVLVVFTQLDIGSYYLVVVSRLVLLE